MAGEIKTIRHVDSGAEILLRARVCDSFWTVFRGYQFSAAPKAGEGLLFDVKRDNRTETAIHMFFVFFDLGVVWVTESGEVVHTCIAKPFRPYYAAPKPARYFIEAAPDIVSRVSVGDRVVIAPYTANG
jgi:uncharacterized protein